MNHWVLLPIAALSALPLAVLAIPYTFALRAALFLGHWPYYGHPDPKDLPEHFDPPQSLEVIIPAAAFVVLTGLVVLWLRRFARADRRLLIAVLMPIALWLLAMGLLYTDPAGVMDWFLD